MASVRHKRSAIFNQNESKDIDNQDLDDNKHLSDTKDILIESNDSNVNDLTEESNSRQNNDDIQSSLRHGNR